MECCATVPENIRKWNWGAFFLSWIWGIANQTYIAFLVFVPIVGLVIPIYLGIKGNELAWKNKEWRSVEHFKRDQKLLSRIGLILMIVGLVVCIIIPLTLMTVFSNIAPIPESIYILNNKDECTEIMGEPIKKGFFFSGSISSNSTSGHADIQIPVKGTKEKGKLYVKATKEYGEWTIESIHLKVDSSKLIITLIE